MNGLTPVLLGNDILAVQYMESQDVGTGGVAAGDIYCSSKSTAGAPTVAQTIEKIVTADGRSMSGRIMVPYGFTAYLLGWKASAIANTMDVRVRGTVFTDDRSLSTGFHFQETAYLAAGSSHEDDLHMLSFPAGAVLKVSAIPGAVAAGNRCDASLHFMFIQDAT